MTNIFVGNLSYQTTQEDLHAAFAQYGNVERVNIVTDRDTGQPRGFAFVEMTEKRDAETAIAQLNGAELNGRAINVNEARPNIFTPLTPPPPGRPLRVPQTASPAFWVLTSLQPSLE
jgi:cold-inducible RNA-binding protein